MGSRKIQRHKAILPIKLYRSDNTALLAHTVDISITGLRAAVTTLLQVGEVLLVEYKHRRVPVRVIWCCPVGQSGFEHEVGLRLNKADSKLWGVLLSAGQEERGTRMAPLWSQHSPSKQILR